MKNVEAYLSLKSDNIINLSSNESYLGVSDELYVMMKSAANKVNLNRYPKVEDEEIKEMYSIYLGNNITKKNIIVGNGSDEMLGLVISSSISYGKKALLLSTDFGMFDYYISVNGGDIVKYKTSEDNYIDVDEFINYGKKEKVDLIIFSNPNNPTGNVLSRDNIIKILRAFPDIYVVIDEAYYEFYGKSMVNDIEEFNNLIVTRTLSKAWGLAALRIGFLISNKENVKRLEKYKVPYTISAISEAMVKVALKDIKRVKEDSKRIVEARNRLYEDLKEIENEAVLKIKFYKSNANFIFGRTPYKEALLKGLKLHGICIRNFKDDSFRITVGSSFENKRLLESIESVFVYGDSSMKERKAVLKRDTNETNIELEMNLDGTGKANIDTPIGFFNHMLNLFAFSSGIDLNLHAKGDVDVCDHHLVEDVAIVLGKVFSKALGDKVGIKRYGTFFVPMDETLAAVSLDISGRSFLQFQCDFVRESIGDFSTEMVKEFFRAFAFNSGITLHARVLYGENDHHKAEALFKALGRAIRDAKTIDENNMILQSTKGVL